MLAQLLAAFFNQIWCVGVFGWLEPALKGRLGLFLPPSCFSSCCASLQVCVCWLHGALPLHAQGVAVDEQDLPHHLEPVRAGGQPAVRPQRCVHQRVWHLYRACEHIHRELLWLRMVYDLVVCRDPFRLLRLFQE